MDLAETKEAVGEKIKEEELRGRMLVAGKRSDTEHKVQEYKNQEEKAKKDKDLATTELDQLISKRRVFKDEMAKI